MGSASFLPAPPAAAQVMLSSGAGSVEFVATVKSNDMSFLRPQTVLRATSGDGAERFEVKVSGSDLIAIRDVRPCLRLSARVQNALQAGVSRRIAVRWNSASAAVSVGGGREAPLEPSRADEFPRFAPLALALGSRDIETQDLAVNGLPALSEAGSDRRFLEQTRCFDPVAAATGEAQASYKGVALRGFADPAQLALARRWIGEMTPATLAAVGSVAIAGEGAPTWRGLALPGALRAMLLRPEALAEPGVFFHEGAHLLDASRGWRDSRDWGALFMGLPQGSPGFSSGAVGHLDASAPGEQLADFVGRSREEALGFASARICAADGACAGKLQFLADRGYISRADNVALSSQQSLLSVRLPGAASPGALSASGGAGAPAGSPALAAAGRSPRPGFELPTPNPNYRTDPIVPRPDASVIDVVIDPRYFRPIDIYHDGGLTVSPTWRGCKAEDVMNRLTRHRPSAIVSEPRLRGVSRSYGYFDLGTRKARRHYFALDELPDGRIEMLVDMKGNGRLDQEPPRPNVGQFKDGGKGYATLLEFPWSDVMDNPPWSGNFKLWFMSNPFEWAIAGFSKSSRTQLLGSLELPGQKYDFIVADGAHSDNDGDLSNDGVCLRKPGEKAVCYRDAEARAGVVVDGRRYAFNVRYR